MRLYQLEEKSTALPDAFKKEIAKIKVDKKKPFGGMEMPGGSQMQQDHMAGSFRPRARKSITSKNYK